MLADDFPEFMNGQSRTPQAYGGKPVTLHLEVADAAWAKVLAIGATIVFPLKTSSGHPLRPKLANLSDTSGPSASPAHRF